MNRPFHSWKELRISHSLGDTTRQEKRWLILPTIGQATVILNLIIAPYVQHLYQIMSILEGRMSRDSATIR